MDLAILACRCQLASIRNVLVYHRPEMYMRIHMEAFPEAASGKSTRAVGDDGERVWDTFDSFESIKQEGGVAMITGTTRFGR